MKFIVVIMALAVSGCAKQIAVSDFCQIAGPQIAKLKNLSQDEIKALQRPRKEAILTLRRTFAAQCK